MPHLQGLDDATIAAAAVAMGIRRLSFPTGDASATQHAKAPHVMIPIGASSADPVARYRYPISHAVTKHAKVPANDAVW